MAAFNQFQIKRKSKVQQSHVSHQRAARFDSAETRSDAETELFPGTML